jgi:hypothetical protein
MSNDELRQQYKEILDKTLFAQMLERIPDQSEYHRNLLRSISNTRVAALKKFPGFDPAVYLSLDILLGNAVENKVDALMQDPSHQSQDLSDYRFGREIMTPDGPMIDDEATEEEWD